MKTIAHIACAVLPCGPHRVGTQGPDRFANATELPPLEVTLPAPVALACDLVTEREYAPFAPGKTAAPGNLPVVEVSWHEANDFCLWLEQQTGCQWRLPSESEWEIACRAGTETPFSTGHVLPTEAANYLYDESGEQIGPGQRTPAGAYPPNAWGLRDMHGNVAEWCSDGWHPSHHGAAADGSPRAGSAEEARVIRGGAWDLLPRLLRSAQRDALPPGTRRDTVGFRLALTLSTGL